MRYLNPTIFVWNIFLGMLLFKIFKKSRAIRVVLFRSVNNNHWRFWLVVATGITTAANLRSHIVDPLLQ